jgi:hypothetical protein
MLAAVKLTAVEVIGCRCSIRYVRYHDLLCKAWTNRGLIFSAQGRIINNILRVRYVYLTKAKNMNERQTSPFFREDVA